MAKIVSLIKESKDVLHKYVAMGILNDTQGYNILRAEDAESIVIAMTSLININESVEDIIFKYLRCSVEQDDDKETLLSVSERRFFHHLLKNRGILSRSAILNKNAASLTTPFLVKEATDALSDRKLIDVFYLSNGETLYIMNLEFYREVMEKR